MEGGHAERVEHAEIRRRGRQRARQKRFGLVGMAGSESAAPSAKLKRGSLCAAGERRWTSESASARSPAR